MTGGTGASVLNFWLTLLTKRAQEGWSDSIVNDRGCGLVMALSNGRKWRFGETG